MTIFLIIFYFSLNHWITIFFLNQMTSCYQGNHLWHGLHIVHKVGWNIHLFKTYFAKTIVNICDSASRNIERNRTNEMQLFLLDLIAVLVITQSCFCSNSTAQTVSRFTCFQILALLLRSLPCKYLQRPAIAKKYLLFILFSEASRETRRSIGHHNPFRSSSLDSTVPQSYHPSCFLNS